MEDKTGHSPKAGGCASTRWYVDPGHCLRDTMLIWRAEGNPWYVPFPRGYWLYEKSKHLWVSGYPLKSKLFKTPQEFALHLLWLLSGSKDYKDCCCVHCNPPSLPKQSSADDTPTLAAASPVKPDKASAPKNTPVPIPQVPVQGKPAAAAPAPVSHRTQAALRAASGSPAKQQTPTIAPQPQAQHQQQQQQQPQQQHQQQQQPATVWSLKSPILFRTGELVWYKNGQAWRLGIISASTQHNNYALLAIGHGMAQLQNSNKSAEDMRPFYAFSVPPATIPELKNKTFDEIPWEAMFRATGNDPTKRDLLALDASKLAASKIDFSYSLWSPFPQAKEASGITSYYGCFFGAERIEVGDSLRLRNLSPELNIASDTAILGLRHIYTSADHPNQVFFRGHIYVMLKNDAPSALDPSLLPVALRDEVTWRNSVSKSTTWRFALAKENVPLQETHIRGRFYPTHRLVPILDPPRFQHAVTTGAMEDQLAHLNNRMDGQGRYIGLKRGRLDTAGVSVGHGVKLELEDFIKEEM